jgi:dipeptide/tripeptide permease
MDESTVRIFAFYGLSTLLYQLLSFKANFHKTEDGTVFTVYMGGVKRIYIDTRLGEPDDADN